MNRNPVQYHRNSKKWKHLIGKSAKVILATDIFVTSEELEPFLPYQFLIVELIDKLNDIPKRLEVMGSANVEFKVGEKVCLELKKLSCLNDSSIIPYGIKASKI